MTGSQAVNGTRKRAILRHERCSPVVEPLRVPAQFAQARLDPDLHTGVWPNDADFAPDFLLNYETEAIATR